MPVGIREATENDIERMLPLLQHLFSLEVDFDFDVDAARRGLLMLLRHKERAVAFVAEIEGRMVGMCSAQLVCSTAVGGYSAWVEDVVVDPRDRRRGIAREMLEHTAAWCRSRGVERMQLVADHNNTAALEFYRHSGWEPTHLQIVRRSP